MEIQGLPFNIDINKKIFNLFDKKTCKVAVNYCILNSKVVKIGSSRPCGCNHCKTSIHAEEIALRYCLKYPHKKYKIIIWRWDKHGKINEKFCCSSCTKLLKKFNYEKNIFTISNDKIITAIQDNPEYSLSYLIKNDLL